MTQIKQAMFNGDENAAVAVLPSVAAGAFPETPKAGAFQRFMERGKRWKTAPGYTSEIGTALGYDGGPQKPVASSVKPVIKLSAAASGHLFSIGVTNRGEAKMWDVFILRKGGQWIKVETCSGRAANVAVPFLPPDNAEQIQVRVQLRKNNANYGQVSEPAYVTLNP